MGVQPASGAETPEHAPEGPPAEQSIVFDQKLHGPSGSTDAIAIDSESWGCEAEAVDVTIEVSDSYEGRASGEAQLNEQVVVELMRDSEVVAATGPTPDLSDEFDAVSRTVNLGELPDPQAGDLVRVRMADEAAIGNNSIRIGELLLEPICPVPPEVVIEETVVIKEVVVVEEKVVIEEVIVVEEREVFTEVIVCRSKYDGVLLRMYDVYFDRQPDLGGFAYWSNKMADGMTALQISEFFHTSSEFSKLSPLADRQFVELLYRNGLEREADAAGLAYWEARLATDLSRPTMVALMMTQDEALKISCGTDFVDS